MTDYDYIATADYMTDADLIDMADWHNTGISKETVKETVHSKGNCKTCPLKVGKNMGNYPNIAVFTVPEFLFLMKEQQAKLTGVYVLHNITKELYYVGQAQNVWQRVRQHISGEGGNGDVYADYKNGDTFEIRIIKFGLSGYDNLDALEKDIISLYAARSRGYNRREGNSGFVRTKKGKS